MHEAITFGYELAISHVEEQIHAQLQSRKQLAGFDADKAVWIQYRPLMDRLKQMREGKARELQP